MIKALKHSTRSTTTKSSSETHDTELGVNASCKARNDTASTPSRGSRPGQLRSRSSFWHSRTQRQHGWTRTNSYFALLGGFVVDTSIMSVRVLGAGKTRGKFKISALITIARTMPMVLPETFKGAIRDKSRASGPAKLLVGVQASWFCGQTIG